MLAPFGPFLSGLVTSFQGTVAIPLIAIGALFVGAAFMFGNHVQAKLQAWLLLLGGALFFLATPIATAISTAVPH